MEPGLARTWPRSTSSRLVPRKSTPTLSPASPWSRSFLNISTPVTVVLVVGLIPTISISSPTLTMPRSMRPVTTVPLPEMENTSSMGMRNGPSMARLGWGGEGAGGAAGWVMLGGAAGWGDVGGGGVGEFNIAGFAEAALVAWGGFKGRADDDRGLVAGEAV